MRRVAITGAGTINALGLDVASTFAAFREGRCGITDLDFRDVDRLAVRIGGQVHGWVPEDHFNRQQCLLYDKFTQFTLLAAKQAVAQSGLSFAGELGLCSGVVLGTAAGGMNTWDENYRTVFEEGKNRVHP
ncbi:MAG: beta-ketoacyl synthase N-terminal-like domain-containing protein, partial [Paracoccus sp. (in: a-proteobacteria)]|uniref:beta-ketoacyl synthase N-terminal-like domain-containing protein n=1 Tax=Paracoccus sp. TaxID=267 RepID=UPI0026DFBA52